MKIAFINDTHAGARQESQIFNEYFFLFWENTFFPYLKKNNITRIFHFGDLVDRRKFINFIIANSWRKRFFDRARDEGITMDLIPGNHDVPYRNTNEINAIEELLHHYPNINIYTKPEVVKYDGLPVLVMPWINSSNYEESIDMLKNAQAKICFGHFEISGFEMDRGSVCDNGFNRDLFDRFDYVFSGHFHHKSTDGKIFYLGAQYEMTWADFDDPKGFHVFNTGDLSLELVKNPYKIFHKVWYDDTDENQQLKYWQSQDLGYLKNCYVKVIVTNKTNPFLFDKVLELIYSVSPAEIIIVEDYGTIYEDTEEVVNEAEDTMTIVSKYIDNSLTDKSLDKERLKKLVRELHVEAINTEKI
jgi:DNA repair exonuclease SbcCD nuclease subunit